MGKDAVLAVVVVSVRCLHGALQMGLCRSNQQLWMASKGRSTRNEMHASEEHMPVSSAPPAACDLQMTASDHVRVLFFRKRTQLAGEFAQQASQFAPHTQGILPEVRVHLARRKELSDANASTETCSVA